MKGARLLKLALVRIPFALVMGAVTFWVGFAWLVLMSTRIMADVARGHAPAAAIALMQERRERRGPTF